MRLTSIRRALLLAMMQSSNAQFQALSQTLCLLMLGLTQKLVFLAPWVTEHHVKLSSVKDYIQILTHLCIYNILANSNDCFIILVTSQRYEIDILRESVIVGNDAIFKCSIPSFVSDFVFVDAWIDSEANILGSSSFDFGN